MSKLDDLIKKFCPSGVEYKTLGEVCRFQNGFSFKSPLFKSKGLPILRITNISNGEISDSDYVYFEKSDYKEDLSNYEVKKGDVVVAMSGATTGKIGYNYSDNVYYLNQRVGLFVPNEQFLLKRYLFHWLTGQCNNILHISSGSGAQPNLSSVKMMEFEIPVPPLEIQSEIVQILDKFTSLEAELEAELEARRKQYEYYRDSLLTFGDDAMPDGRQVEWKTLGEITKYSDTRIKNSDIQPYTYVSVENLLQQKKGVEFTNKIPEGNNSIEYLKEDILIGNIRPYLRKIWKADRNGGTNGDVLTIRILNDYKQRIDSKYLYYQLSSEDFFNYDNQHAKGAKMPRGSKDDVMKYPIPIPSPSEQQRIVNILDRFELLCNDTTSGLPAEIEARHKQYEYYRDKLLTFKRKEAV